MTTEGSDDYWTLRERYWRALGQFVDEFAEIEKLVYILLMLEAQVDHATAADEYGRMGVSQLLKRIRKARSAHDAPPHEILARGLEGLQVIKDRRDAVLHRGAQAARDGTLWVNDALWSTNPKPFTISPGDLKDMIRDLPTIKACLVFYIMTDVVERVGTTEGHALSMLGRHQVALGFAQQAIVPWHSEDLRSREP
jgi:hypothetical protein